ncbi:MAG: hypothetical protein ACKVH8_23080 [Pirellulales bacterium]
MIKRFLIVSLLFVSLPFILWGALVAWNSNENKVEDWFPNDWPETQELEHFVDQFGREEILMISWEGCSLEDPRIQDLQLRLLQEVETTTGRIPYYQDIFTGPDMLDLYQSSPLLLSRFDAEKKMSGWILSPNGKTTCLIAIISDQAADDLRAEAIEHVYLSADEVVGPEKVCF